MQRTDWEELSNSTRKSDRGAHRPRTKCCHGVGWSELRYRGAVETDAGRVFVEGLRTEHPMAAAQRREVAVSPYVSPLSP
jgi:hypothetical protein